MNFDLVLYGKNEFYPGLNKKTYNILKVDSKQKINFMIDHFKNFIHNQKSNPNEKHYLGIDFEFNKISKGERDVALMQINMENKLDKGFIFVFYPPDLTNGDKKVLIDLLTQPKIIKILHGSESLDIPYLFHQLLIKNNLIKLFCDNFYDTKYLCDYAHIKENKTTKCSIYFLLNEYNVMTDNKKEELEKIEEKTGPIYQVHIDINKMSNDILAYSLYDVIYLPDLIKKFMNLGKPYTDIIPETTQIVFKFKRDIEPEFNDLEKMINQMNIYFIRDNSYMVSLKDIWESYYWIIDSDDNVFYNIKQINYFKNFFEIISKLSVYSNLSTRFKIWKNKKEIVTIFDFEKYYKWLSVYPNLYKLFVHYDDLIGDDLDKIIKRTT
jgi:hypothetical protein